MYAVIEAGGKQYRVELGTELEIDRMDAEPGSSIDLGRVLLVSTDDGAQIGRPVVEGARVTADVLRQDRGEKIDVFKYRPKARTRVKKGHRAELTVVRISDILLNGKSAAKVAEAESKQAEAERAAAEKEAAKKAAADQALASKLAAEEAAAEAAEKKAAKPTTKADAKPAAKSSAKATDAKAAKPAAKSAAKPAAKAESKSATTKSAAKPAAKPAAKAAPKTARTKKDE